MGHLNEHLCFINIFLFYTAKVIFLLQQIFIQQIGHLRGIDFDLSLFRLTPAVEPIYASSLEGNSSIFCQ